MPKVSLWRQPKRSPYWYVRYKDPITRKNVCLSTNTTNKRRADEICRQVDIRVNNAKFGIENLATPVMMSQYAERFIDDYAMVNNKPGTVKIARDAFRNFINLIGDVAIGDVNEVMIEKFKKLRGVDLSPVTVNIDFKALRSAFSVAKKWKLIPANPFKEVRMLPEGNVKAIRAFTTEERKRIFAVMECDLDRDLYHFYEYTGARLTEVAELRREDVKLDLGKIDFCHDTKHSKNRMIPIPDKAMSILRRQLEKPGLPGDRIWPYNRKQISQRFSRYRDKADLDPALHLHCLRHTFATVLIAHNIGTGTVRDILGHSTVRVTEKYVHLPSDDMRKAMNKFK